MEEQIKFIAGYLYGCRAIFNGKNLEETDKALNRLAEIESELKKLRVADVSGMLKSFVTYAKSRSISDININDDTIDYFIEDFNSH